MESVLEEEVKKAIEINQKTLKEHVKFIIDSDISIIDKLDEELLVWFRTSINYYQIYPDIDFSVYKEKISEKLPLENKKEEEIKSKTENKEEEEKKIEEKKEEENRITELDIKTFKNLTISEKLDIIYNSDKKDRYSYYTKSYTSNSTLLHLAAKYSTTNFIFNFLNFYATKEIVGKRDSYDETALEIAALRRRDPGIVKILVRAEGKRKNKYGETTLMRACQLMVMKPLQNEMTQIISELLAYEAKMTDNTGKTAFYRYLSAPSSQNIRIPNFLQDGILENYGYFSLENFHMVENDTVIPKQSNNQDLVEIMELAKTMNTQNKPVATKQLTHSEILSLLVKNEHNIKDKHKRIALHFAAQLGHLEFVKILSKEALGDIGSKDDRGQTALMCAIRGYAETRRKKINDQKLLNRYVDIVDILAKSETNIADKVGITPIMLAKGYGLHVSPHQLDKKLYEILEKNSDQIDRITLLGKKQSQVIPKLQLTGPEIYYDLDIPQKLPKY